MEKLHHTGQYFVFALFSVSALLLLWGCAGTSSSTQTSLLCPPPEQITEIKQKAVAGDTAAQIGLAEWYRLFCGGYDQGTAAGWFRRAAEQGHAGAQFTLANMYRNGEGVTQDITQAENWYRKAAEQGHIGATSRLEQIIMERDPLAWEREQQEILRAKQEKERLEAEARIAAIQALYGQQLGLVVIPLDSEIKIEQPRRTKPEHNTAAGSGGYDALGYLMPSVSTGVLLPILAGALVVELITWEVKKQLSDAEKKEIKAAAENLPNILTTLTVEQNLRQRIIDSGEMSSGSSLYMPVVFQSSDLGPDRYQKLGSFNTVVEVETSGLGLVLAEKQYRPARFLMANQIQVIRAADGEILKRQSPCFASTTRNFSEWGVDDGKQLRGELEDAYTHTAENILLMLAGTLDDATIDEQDLCVALEEKVRQYRAKMEPDAR